MSISCSCCNFACNAGSAEPEGEVPGSAPVAEEREAAAVAFLSCSSCIFVFRRRSNSSYTHKAVNKGRMVKQRS